jgi:hypothetical protein
METRNSRPLVEAETSTGWLPAGGLRWIQLLAIACLVVVAMAYLTNASKSGAATMRTAISEPGTTVLPSVR